MLTTEPTPGLAMYAPYDGGFVPALCGAEHPTMGWVVWVGEAEFASAPTLDEVAAVETWRYSIITPLEALLRLGDVVAVGHVELPPALRAIPDTRLRRNAGGWLLVRGGVQQAGVATDDPDLPIEEVVFGPVLRRRLAAAWRPADKFSIASE